MLTLEQRAERAAKRRNNKVAAKEALFADQFATNVETEKNRLAKWDEGLSIEDVAAVDPEAAKMH